MGSPVIRQRDATSSMTSSMDDDWFSVGFEAMFCLSFYFLTSGSEGVGCLVAALLLATLAASSASRARIR
jgi:hypothetical protein